MSVIQRVVRMLSEREKLWLSPLFLAAVAIGAITMKNSSENRESFIYTLF